MNTIGLLPLDERPCNYIFPQQMCWASGQATLLCPPASALGQKKKPASFQDIAHWLSKNAKACQIMVISIDMLVYGGIVPSRLHHLSLDMCKERLDILRQIKKENPGLILYGFNLIMRAPSYSSSEEEPDYYGVCGKEINQIGQCIDKQERFQGTAVQESQAQLLQAQKVVPTEVLKDFQQRRQINAHINFESIALVEEGILDFLVIPLDDCALYGWAPREQRLLRKQVVEKNLGMRVHIYSGADDVGSVLTARAANHLWNRRPLVHVRGSATKGSLIIPKYEDRFFGESVKWQIITAGGLPCTTVEEADWILMTNEPPASGENMAEVASRIEDRDAAYHNSRCLPEFVLSFERLIKEKPVALADVAFGNGADDELMNLLSGEGLLERLFAYGGWNTAANAMGTCIAQAMLRQDERNETDKFTTARLVEDWGYMVHLRAEALIKDISAGGNGFNLGEKGPQLALLVQEGLNLFLQSKSAVLGKRWKITEVAFPWDRLFELSFSLEGSLCNK